MKSEGKIRAATHLLEKSDGAKTGEPLDLDDVMDTPEGTDTVRNILLKKHPPAQPSALLLPMNKSLPFHSVIFDSIDATAIPQGGYNGHYSVKDLR